MRALLPDGRTQNCSGAVYNSAKKNLVVTASHCVRPPGSNGTAKPVYTNIRFAPAGDWVDGNPPRPFGSFNAKYLYTSSACRLYGDQEHDWAVIAVHPNEYGQVLQDAVGALGWEFNADDHANAIRGTTLMHVGYPTNYDNGNRQYYCTGPQDGAYYMPPPRAPNVPTNFVHGTWCNFSYGGSGSPYFNRTTSVAKGVLAYKGAYERNFSVNNNMTLYNDVWKRAAG